LLLAGCATSAPDGEIHGGQTAVTASVGLVATAAPSAELATSPIAAPGTATGAVAAPAVGAQTSPTPVVDLNRQPPTENAEVICRQMLKPTSNVIVTRCMTRADWKTYDRAEARWAQDTLLRMQGSFR
jgi:hypothetical protein